MADNKDDPPARPARPAAPPFFRAPPAGGARGPARPGAGPPERPVPRPFVPPAGARRPVPPRPAAPAPAVYESIAPAPPAKEAPSITVEARSEAAAPAELEPIGPPASLGRPELEPRQAERGPEAEREVLELAAIAEPVAATPETEAVAQTIEADGGVTDLREAERAAETAPEVTGRFEAATAPPPAPARPEPARPAAPVEERVPDVEIPDWLRTDPAQRALGMGVETPRAPEPPPPPVAAAIDTDEVVLKPFADDTPARGSTAFGVMPPAEPDAPATEFESGSTSLVGGAPQAQEEADESQPFAASVELGEPSEATLDSVPEDEPVTWEEPQLTGQAEHWEGEETPVAPDAAVYAGDDVFDWASSATSSVHPVDPAEGLAEALEMLAQRLRRGELQAPLYRQGMSDAAALTAALASVLGIRR